ncbi:MAG: VWA domain-containing protein [Pyrinomonadaceae bacterium]|nr:VWA domain-containing protein [Pyrinomonadaceae bacterium]MBP6211851.1 VWA domain-containing protein [Pyrinomonadaceae bacterium]
MRSFLLFLAFANALAAIAIGQTATPTPRPLPTDDGDVVKISTSLIQLDVTVIDQSGKVVGDLRPDEIEIYENGEKQKITNFSFVSAVKPITLNSVPVDKGAIPVPQAVLRPDKVRRTFSLVVDDLSLSFESAYQTRRALKKFVDEQMQEGDLVAIIRTGAGIGALQQFTSDKRILYAAIERVKWNPIGNGGISAFAPVDQTFSEMIDAAGGGSLDQDGEPGTVANSQIAFENFRSSVFATGTLGALRYIVQGMSELPGRKSVILFSDGFSMFETDEHGFTQSGRVAEFLRELVDVANRSSVVFYTIDARGLQYTGFTAVDKVTDTSPQAMSAKLSERRDQLFNTQAGLAFLAEETGGIAIKNNNDLAGGVRRVLEDQSYYLIAYEPDTETFDAAKRKYNKIEVKVLRKGLEARYRSGFFNVADKVVTATPTKMTPMQELQTALTSPFAVDGIPLRLNALFGNDPVAGSYVRSLLHVSGKDLKFTDEPDGTKKAVFDVWAASFGDNGQPVDQIGKSYTLIVKPEGFKKLMADGFVYHFTFPVKKPGAYQYRVAIRDTQGERVGSASQFIEVPNLKNERLTGSSIVLESLTPAQWQVLSDPNGAAVRTDSMTDTAVRRVRLNTVLRYGFEIYNAKLNATKQPDIQTRIRVFRDGKLVLDGQSIRLDMQGQSDMQRLRSSGAISIGGKLLPGDYILQVIITDSLAPQKRQVTTQFVQFEVVE